MRILGGTQFIFSSPSIAVTEQPEISGTLVVGQTLSCSDGAASGVGSVTISKQWFRSGSPIEGETGDTYELVDADDGIIPMCRVTYTDDVRSKSVFAVADEAVVNVAPSITGQPSISGVLEVGELITFVPASVTGTSVRQWQLYIDEELVYSGGGSGYLLQPDDEGKTLVLRQVEVNSGGSDTADSVESGIVNAATDFVLYPTGLTPDSYLSDGSGGFNLTFDSGVYAGTYNISAAEISAAAGKPIRKVVPTLTESPADTFTATPGFYWAHENGGAISLGVSAFYRDGATLLATGFSYSLTSPGDDLMLIEYAEQAGNSFGSTSETRVTAQVASAPAAFGEDDWDIDANGDVTIDDAPFGATNIEYRINGGSPVSAGTIGGFSTGASEADNVEIRALNSVGPSGWSLPKPVPSSGPSLPEDEIAPSISTFALSGGYLDIYVDRDCLFYFHVQNATGLEPEEVADPADSLAYGVRSLTAGANKVFLDMLDVPDGSHTISVVCATTGGYSDVEEITDNFEFPLASNGTVTNWVFDIPGDEVTLTIGGVDYTVPLLAIFDNSRPVFLPGLDEPPVAGTVDLDEDLVGSPATYVYAKAKGSVSDAFEWRRGGALVETGFNHTVISSDIALGFGFHHVVTQGANIVTATAVVAAGSYTQPTDLASNKVVVYADQIEEDGEQDLVNAVPGGPSMSTWEGAGYQPVVSNAGSVAVEIAFDGSNDYQRAAGVGDIYNNDGAILMIVKGPASPGGYVFGISNPATPVNRMRAYGETNGTMTFAPNPSLSGAYYGITDKPVVFDDNWHLLVITCTGKSWNYAVDGVWATASAPWEVTIVNPDMVGFPGEIYGSVGQAAVPKGMIVKDVIVKVGTTDLSEIAVDSAYLQAKYASYLP